MADSGIAHGSASRFLGGNRKGVNFLLPTGSCVVPSLRVILREGEARTEVLVREQKRLRLRSDPKPTRTALGWARKGSTNVYCYLFVVNVTFYDAKKKVTITWQDSKIPNEIPLRAFAPLFAPQKFDSLRSLRMTHTRDVGYKF